MRAMLVMTCLIVAGAESPPPDGGAAKLPEAFRAALLQRMSLETAHIRYRARTFAGQGTIEECREDQIAGDDILTIDRGDRDGIHGRLPDGRPPIGVSPDACAARRELHSHSSGDCWKYREGADSAGLYDMGPNIPIAPDARTIGLMVMAVPASPARLYEGFVATAGRRKWSETREEGGRVRVRAESDPSPRGRTIQEWLIDPARGFSVLEYRATRKRPDGRVELMGQCETTYEEIDGVWFPKTSKGEHVEGELRWDTEVSDATFNRSEHPKRLTPQLLGMPVGVVIASPQRWGLPPGSPDNPNMKRWNGERIVDWDEWERTKQQYDLSDLKRVQGRRITGRFPSWWDDTAAFGLDGARYRPGLWEDYVRRWCYKQTCGVTHPLTEKQKSAAQAVLKDCQKRAAPIFQRIEKELAGIEKKLDGKTLAPEARQAAAKKKADLTAPIEHIFTTQLVPRLEALLETRQTGPAASQPAAPTPRGPRPSP